MGVMIFLCISGVILLLALLWKRDDNSLKHLLNSGSVVIVTAHPDDECMFFGPTISSLVSNGVEVYILCLSRGDYYGIGDTRVKEFYRSCDMMGVHKSQCLVINDSSLPDGPVILWNEKRILDHVDKFVATKNISAIVTFDEHGVSGHHNHISIYRAIKHYPTSIPRYMLTSINVFRKYSSVFDVFTAFLYSEQVLKTPSSCILNPYRAMFEHKSQLMWFRYLYLTFSRYMLCNSLEQIET